MSRQMEIDFNVDETNKKIAKQQLNDLWAESRSQRVAERASMNVKREYRASYTNNDIGVKNTEIGQKGWPDRS